MEFNKVLYRMEGMKCKAGDLLTLAITIRDYEVYNLVITFYIKKFFLPLNIFL